MEIKSGAVADTLSNRLFNCLHWISPSFREGVEAVYVASTGIDAVLEIDLARPRVCLWDWLATEHGYDRSANGKPRGIDRAIFHQGIEYSTLTHTTHVNSVARYDENTILATLFHQGELVAIDLHSKAVSPVIGGLRNPHSIRRRQDGFMVCDTRGGRVLFLDEGLSECRSIKGDFNWVQDACELADGTVVIADANNHRLLRVDPSGSRIWEWEYGTDRRIGSLLPLSAAHCGAIFSGA